MESRIRKHGLDVDSIGTIEIGYGHDGYVTSWIRALDAGGMV